MKNPRKLCGCLMILMFLLGVWGGAKAQPLPVTTNLQLHLSAQLEVTTGAGDSVTTWADQSSNGNDATQSTGGAKPVLVTNAIGGSSAILFDGTNDNMALSSAVFSSVTTALTFITVARHDDATFDNYETIYSQGAGTARQAMAFLIGNSAGVSTKPAFITDIWQPAGVESGIALSNATDYQATITVANWNTMSIGNTNMWVNGTLGVDAIYGGLTPTALLTTTPKIGSFNTLAGSYFDGYIGEVLLYNSVLSANDRKQVENYCGDWKYSVSGYSPQSTWTVIGTDTTTAALGRLVQSGSNYIFWSDTLSTAVQ